MATHQTLADPLQVPSSVIQQHSNRARHMAAAQRLERSWRPQQRHSPICGNIHEASISPSDASGVPPPIIAFGDSPLHIDYSGYPHIIERILNFCDDETLVTVGLTCRSLKKYTDPLAFRQVTISPDTVFPTPSPCACNSCHPEPPQSPDHLGRVRARLTKTRILDIEMADCTTCCKVERKAMCLVHNMPNLEIIRAHHKYFPSHLSARRDLDHRSLSVVNFYSLAPTYLPPLHNLNRHGRPLGVGTGNVFVNLRYSGSLPDQRMSLFHIMDKRLPSNQRVRFRDTFAYIFMTTEEMNSRPDLSPDQAWERLVEKLTLEDHQFLWFWLRHRVVLVGNWQGQALELVERRQASGPGSFGGTAFDFITFEEMKKRVGKEMFNLAMAP